MALLQHRLKLFHQGVPNFKAFDPPKRDAQELRRNAGKSPRRPPRERKGKGRARGRARGKAKAKAKANAKACSAVAKRAREKLARMYGASAADGGAAAAAAGAMDDELSRVRRPGGGSLASFGGVVHKAKPADPESESGGGLGVGRLGLGLGLGLGVGGLKVGRLECGGLGGGLGQGPSFSFFVPGLPHATLA